MNRRPIYFYFRASWRRRRWHSIRFKRMLVPYRVHLCMRIEKMLGPRHTGFGQHFRNSITLLLYQAAVNANLVDSEETRVVRIRFLRRAAPRPGRRFYAAPGTKLKSAPPDVSYA